MTDGMKVCRAEHLSGRQVDSMTSNSGGRAGLMLQIASSYCMSQQGTTGVQHFQNSVFSWKAFSSDDFLARQVECGVFGKRWCCLLVDWLLQWMETINPGIAPISASLSGCNPKSKMSACHISSWGLEKLPRYPGKGKKIPFPQVMPSGPSGTTWSCFAEIGGPNSSSQIWTVWAKNKC